MRVESNAHWRDSARTIRFFIWDGRLAFPMILPLLYMRIWTWSVALVCMCFFSILNRYGFTPIVFLRWLRTKIAGDRKLVKPSWER
jgi:intracellular multiplication protein IcmT